MAVCIACRRIFCLPKSKHIYFNKSPNLYSTNAGTREITNQKEIVVPYRIERGPTDILKALASTIKKDPTAAHYKYEDDPYFMPASNITKRSYALSKEAGRKAARYFLENYPDMFISTNTQYNISVPHIKQYDPPIVYTENDEVSEKILQECIASQDINNCISVFNILKKKGISISQETKQDLLDLLCFYNSTPPLSEEYYEERFFQRVDEASGSKWDSKGMAEKLFEEMEKDGKAYSSMIAGLSKYGNPERALELFNEMKSKNFKGTIQCYNYLIAECSSLYEESNQYWEQAIHLLHQMNADGLRPDLYTMNALLKILTKSPRWRKGKQFALNVMAEMKRLKIEPSLGSYYYLLKLFAFDSSTASILYEIMPFIEDKEHEIQHPADVQFFTCAMETCCKFLHDKDMAYRIHRLLEHGRNCKLLGNALSESQYFKYFLRVLSEVEDIDVFMELYDKYVPNTYTPEPAVTLSIVQAIHFAGAYKYLPRMCSDVILFEQTERGNILEALLEAAACNQNEEEVQKPLVEMLWNILENLKNRSQYRRLQFDWSGAMLGNLLKTFINGRDLDKAGSILNKLRDEEHLIVGSIPEKTLFLEFCQLCLEFNDYNKINDCVKYAVNSIYPEFKEDLIKFTEDLIEQKKVDESQKAVLIQRIGSLVIDDSADSSSSESSSESSSDSSSDEEEESEILEDDDDSLTENDKPKL